MGSPNNAAHLAQMHGGIVQSTEEDDLAAHQHMQHGAGES